LPFHKIPLVKLLRSPSLPEFQKKK